MSPSSFPRYFTLKSCYNSKYVRHVDELEEHKDFFLCDGLDTTNLHSTFQVEKSQSSTDYFHIVCCYKNKYCAADSDGRIYAGEEKPVEDTSQPNCTLFKRDDRENGEFQLICLKNGKAVNFDLQYYNRTDSQLVLAAAVPICPPEFKAVDWEALVVLPRYVAFKGDNGKYLQVVDKQFMQFIANDRRHKSANFEIFVTPDGTIRVKNDGKFWRAGPNWIYCDSNSDDTDYSDRATLFLPYLIEENVIAIRNLDNNYFCRRTTWDNHRDCLCADNAGITISKEARLKVEEPLSSRKISDIRFRENDYKYYNESVVTMPNVFVSNETTEDQEVEVQLACQYTRSHTWTSNYSSSYSVKMGFSYQVPFYIVGQSYESTTSEDYEWGEVKEFVKTYTRTETVGVKAGTKVKVTLVGTKRHCDVPFAYTREDKLDDGTPITEDNDDGVYTGVYCTDFKSRVEEVSDK